MYSLWENSRTKHNLKVRNFCSFISNKDIAKRKLIKNNDSSFCRFR